jgi:acylaminoacyl-peptidase
VTAWLAGHPKFKDLWAAAVLWNPVLNMSYMLMSSDIPDWVYACALNKNHSFSNLTSEENNAFFQKSPMSVMKNVKTPTIICIGEGDLRVPPAAAYYFYHALQEMGVEARLLNYPGSGHAISNLEHNIDASMQIV